MHLRQSAQFWVALKRDGTSMALRLKDALDEPKGKESILALSTNASRAQSFLDLIESVSITTHDLTLTPAHIVLGPQRRIILVEGLTVCEPLVATCTRYLGTISTSSTPYEHQALTESGYDSILIAHQRSGAREP